MASQPVYYVTYANPAGGGTGPPAPQYPGHGVNLFNPPPPQYPGPGVHVANPPPPQPPGQSASGGYPPPPPYPAGFRPPTANPLNGSGDDPRAADKEHRGEENDTTMKKLLRIWKWVQFLVGNLMSIVGIIYEIVELDVCFEEKLTDSDDDTAEENATTTRDWMLILLVVGLWVDVFSVIALSTIYRSPLDIKSAHKIPLGDTRNLKMTAIVNFLAPFSWGTLYLLGGLVSAQFAEHIPCGGGVGVGGGGIEGSALEKYAFYSGFFMMMFGLGMLILSGKFAPEACSCSSTPIGVQRITTTPRCCCTTWTQDQMHKKILKRSWILDLGWQVQGAVLSYRVGALSLTEAILVGAGFGLGGVLAALGSYAPEEVQELVGPVVG